MQPIRQIELQALMRLAADTDVELRIKPRQGQPESPLMAVLVACRNDAVRALSGLVTVDAEDPKAIRTLQNEVQRFIDLCGHVNGIIRAGDEAESQLSEEEREEVIQAVMSGETQHGED